MPGEKRPLDPTRLVPAGDESSPEDRFPAYQVSQRGDWSSTIDLAESLPMSAIDELDTEAGRVDGRYTVLGILGSGASSTVYRVRDEENGGDWALKLLDANSEIELERFRREQALLQRLKHPNLISMTDSGDWSGRSYMVMPILEEGTLVDWLRATGGRMAYAEACERFRRAALALHTAHEAGVVHRDVKPGNLANHTTPEGAPSLLVLDWGIAKAIHSGASLTDAGKVVGTPAYVSPERLFRGAKATPGWDIYSLGVVMYEVLTGKPLFRRRRWIDTMNAIRRHTPPFISQVRADAPPTLDWLVAEMIAKEPHRRPSGCDVVARRLERIAGELGP